MITDDFIIKFLLDNCICVKAHMQRGVADTILPETPKTTNIGAASP